LSAPAAGIVGEGPGVTLATSPESPPSFENSPMPLPDSEARADPSSLSDTLVGRVRSFKRLPFWPRVLVLLAGWLVILIGIAGLFLPGPGTLAIFAGAALLSVASEVAYKGIAGSLKRWPRLHRNFESLRERLHDRLHAFFHPGDPPTP
jgi:hypothetical protein